MRSPYVLVDGTLSAVLAGEGAEIAIRTLAPKPRNAAEPDQWSEWQTLLTGSGAKQAELGRPRFNGRDVSIHGTYRFQVRVRVPQSAAQVAAGLSALSMKLYFENGIMSIPPLFAGQEQSAVSRSGRIGADGARHGRSTAMRRRAGEKILRQVLRRADFRNGEAEYHGGCSRIDPLPVGFDFVLGASMQRRFWLMALFACMGLTARGPRKPCQHDPSAAGLPAGAGPRAGAHVR